MAQFDEFYCPSCDFNIQTEDSFYYRLMSGYYMTVLCTKCKTIHHVSPPMIHVEDEDDYLNALRMLDIKGRESICPKCGAKGHLRIWEPADGCPKCHRKLKRRYLFIMAD